MLNYRHAHPRSSGTLLSLERWQQTEGGVAGGSAPVVDAAGDLLEFESLELRLHPPNVRIDNESSHAHTVLTIDSANRPGTLVEVVQCLTELGLGVKRARISSDGGWFVDEFHVTETPSGRVLDPKKLDAVRRVLSLREHGAPQEAHTVFQIAGPETPGLLAEVTQLLSHNGLEIRTAAAWTHRGRAAIVIGVTERSAPVRDAVKLQRLVQLLTKLVEASGDDVAVDVEQVDGPVHHERRLHQLLLADAVQAWKQLSRLQRQHSLPFPGPIHTLVAAGGAGACGSGADTAADSDQAPRTPSTPRQQWQRQMLPPTWTFDGRGRPMHRDELQPQPWMGVQGAAPPQQQQQQQQGGDGADDLDPFRAAAAGFDRADSFTSPTGGQQQQQQPPVLAPPRTSVDRLLALLQPQPLAHVCPLLPSQDEAAAAAQQDQQDQHHQEHAGTATAQEEGAVQASTALLPESAAVAAPAAPAPAGGVGGLPPKAPAALRPSVPLPGPPPSNAGANGPDSSSSSRMAPSSMSAPCSPCRATATSHSSAAAAAGSGALMGGVSVSVSGTSTGGLPAAAAGQVPWSQQDLAAAAAAAGMLSPRVLPGGSSRSSSMGLIGLQPKQAPVSSSSSTAPIARDAPEVQLRYSELFQYWLVEIRCRDRNKLFFDSVCTLSDLRFDIFHASIDSLDNGIASQLFYVRPRFGDTKWNEPQAAMLKAMLEAAVQRRFPPGLRVHVFSGSTVCLQDLVSQLKKHRLTITRCKVRAYDLSSGGSHTFFLLNRDQSLPSRQLVQTACQAAGGELVEAPLDLTNPCVATVLKSLDARQRFAFSFVNARSPGAAALAAHGSSPFASFSSSSSSRGVMAPGGPVDSSSAAPAAAGGVGGGVHGAVVRRKGGSRAASDQSGASDDASQAPSF